MPESLDVGGTIQLDFPCPASLIDVTFVGTELPAIVDFLDSDRAPMGNRVYPEPTSSNQVRTERFNKSNVSRMNISLQGAGAIAEVRFTCAATVPPPVLPIATRDAVLKQGVLRGTTNP